MTARCPGIDYEQRPPSYWEDETPAQAILKNIKGQKARLSDFDAERIREGR